MIESNYTYGFESDEGKLKENNGDHRTWSNPLEVQSVLPVGCR
jgi:phospholipid:diacylglycerol acyltransferase